MRTIYFAGSIKGGDQLKDSYQRMIDHLQQHGHTVLTEHIFEKHTLSPYEVYERDIQWIKQCDLVIADVTVPSLGVGYEISYALDRHNIPVLAIYGSTANLSYMVLGNHSGLLDVQAYENDNEALWVLDRYLEVHPLTIWGRIGKWLRRL